MFWVELILVLAIIFLGVRKGGTFLAMAGGVGMLIMTFFFHVTPADPPVTVILIMIAVIVAAATMQACGGLDFLVRIAEKILRRNPRMITVLAPVVAYIFTLLVVCIPATLIGTVACALAVMKKGKELAEDPEFQARVASGQVQTLVKNENAAEVKTTKEAKISVAVFLVAMVGIVLLGAVSALVPTLSDGSKLPLTTVIEIFMLVAAAVTVLITKLDSNKVLDQPVFKTGMFAVVLAFGLCWLVNIFIADQSSFITDNMSVLTNEHPWIYIIAVFIVGAITTSQSSSTMIMVPIGIALGLPANIIVAGWIACSSNYFIPASGQCVAAIAFDTAGTTKIGKYVLNHSYMLPGLVCTVVSVVSAILIGAVVF